MAKYRNVSVKFWSDDFVTENLTPEKRYFFLYLLTNEHTSQCGIYQITVRQMAFETGYNHDTVENLLKFFEEKGKIKWSRSTNEIAIKNFVKYNPQGSPKVKVFVEKELKEVKNRDLLEFIENLDSSLVKPIDTVSQKEEELEIEKEEELELKVKPTLLEIDVRKDIFRESLVPFADKYDKQMLKAFFDYWTETNRSKKKMRFEDQKFFDLTKRLSTWYRNDDKFGKKPGAVTKSTFQSPFEKRNIHA